MGNGISDSRLFDEVSNLTVVYDLKPIQSDLLRFDFCRCRQYNMMTRLYLVGYKLAFIKIDTIINTNCVMVSILLRKIK